MSIKYIILISVTLQINDIFGQTNTTKNGTPLNQKNGITIGYYGFKFSNPGLQTGIERNLATTRNFQFIASLLTQFHYQKDQQTAIALNIRTGQRYTTDFGLMFENYIGMGVQHTFYTSIAYDLTNNPVTLQKTRTNKTGVIPNIALGLGYDFSRTVHIPFLCYFRPNISWLYPDKNLVFTTSANFEAGIVYKIQKEKS